MRGFRRFEKSVLAAGGTLVCHHENLLDQQWHDRPALPPAASWQMPIENAGKSVAEKSDDLAAYLDAKGCAAVLLDAGGFGELAGEYARRGFALYTGQSMFCALSPRNRPLPFG